MKWKNIDETADLQNSEKYFIRIFLSAIDYGEGVKTARKSWKSKTCFLKYLENYFRCRTNFQFWSVTYLNTYLAPYTVFRNFQKICFPPPTLAAPFTPSTWMVADNKKYVSNIFHYSANLQSLVKIGVYGFDMFHCKSITDTIILRSIL